MNDMTDTNQEKVLIVDDVETNRLILEDIITNMDCFPILAGSGEEALQKMKECHPQLVLTDIAMPGMNGYELCRILKKDKETSKIPIVFISAFDDPKDIVEGFLIGGEDYITKPFIPEVVQSRVGVQLRLYEASRELTEMNRRLRVSVSEQLKQMEEEKKNILYALAEVVAHNSNYEEEHIGRIKQNCRVLAQGMQLSPLFEDKVSDMFIDTIELSAPLYDIGNVGIPMELLQKKGELTEEEEAVLREHTDIGVRFLGKLHVNNDYNDFISTSIDIAHYHHENWDGSGYPTGISGNEIPLAAQIVSVIDRYCKLTGKEAKSREDALEVMSGESGVRFNPDIVKILCKISRQLS